MKLIPSTTAPYPLFVQVGRSEGSPPRRRPECRARSEELVQQHHARHRRERGAIHLVDHHDDHHLLLDSKHGLPVTGPSRVCHATLIRSISCSARAQPGSDFIFGYIQPMMASIAPTMLVLVRHFTNQIISFTAEETDRLDAVNSPFLSNSTSLV